MSSHLSKHILPGRFCKNAIHGAISFRLLLLMLFMATGLLPLLLNMFLNLPHVISVLESTLEENQITNLKEKLLDVNNRITRRTEGVHLLANIPGVRDLVSGQAQEMITPGFVRTRLSRVIRELFTHHQDIKNIAVMDINGRELFMMIRVKGNGFRQAGADELEIKKDAIEKIKSLNSKDQDFTILAINSRTLLKDKVYRTQHVDITIGSPVYGNNGHISGAVAITLDITDILNRFQFNFLVGGTGNFVYSGKPHENGHIHEQKAAFMQFPGLQELMRIGKPSVLRSADGKRVVWVPIISGPDPKQSIWCGAPVDYSAVQGVVKSTTQRVTLIGLVIMLVVFVIVWRLSNVADHFRAELVQALKDLLHNNTPIQLKWERPQEIKEMGQAINDLSRNYRITMEERRKAEENLKILNRRLNMILENAAEGILELDSSGNIEYANSAACKILGFNRYELLGNDLHSLVHYLRKDRSQYPEEECPFCSAIEDGNYNLFRQDIFWRKNGEPVEVEYLTAPIFDENRHFMGMVMCIRDVTERRKAKRKAELLQAQLLQSQKMEAIGTLAGGVAHEFNNLLTAITGYGELLAEDMKDKPHALKQVKCLVDAASRASELTRQLLAFSRKQTPRLRIVEINELVQKQQKMLRRLIGENVELEAELDPSESLKVLADPGMIEQVLVNLIVNARDAMPDGGRITLRTGRRVMQHPNESLKTGNSPGGVVCISVEDNGSGIQEDDLKQIFTPFFTTKPAQKGTGLGLSVVWGIIEQHGGWINVESTPGKGTVFRLYLPEYGGGDVDVEAEPKLESIDIAGRGRTILMLEDDEMVRNIAKEIFQSYGFEVICAENVQEAKQKFTENRSNIQLVFSDVVLPDGNGVEFAKWVREQVPEMPVVLASGYTGANGRVEEIRKMGFPFLQKPFKVHKLLTTIDRAMKESVKT